ncbi:MAG: FKBP-type peptidyl-prolyl cis-trans isomerase SlyD [Planctomycetota bacterium]
MEIAENKVVAMEYTLTGSDGEVLDTSDGRGPLAYIHGKGGIIPGLEEELAGKVVGDELTVVVPPEKAYGPRNDQLLNRVPKEAFKGEMEFELGLQFPVQDEKGNGRTVTIVHIEEDTVVLDANHPLAGEELTFQVKILEVRDATEEELSHGHSHGQGGASH